MYFVFHLTIKLLTKIRLRDPREMRAFSILLDDTSRYMSLLHARHTTVKPWVPIVI